MRANGIEEIYKYFAIFPMETYKTYVDEKDFL